jgi:hypothetical protein
MIMDTGMLWFDNDPKVDLYDKIIRAATYYKNKYGKTPDLCYVHPSMLNEKRQRSQGIEIRTHRQVLPNHLWLGINDLHQN